MQDGKNRYNLASGSFNFFACFKIKKRKYLISNMKDKGNKKTSDNDFKFISLKEASRVSGYTAEHLNLCVRKGFLRGEKIGRNWFTKKEWLDDFVSSSAGKYQKRNAQPDESATLENEEEESLNLLKAEKARFFDYEAKATFHDKERKFKERKPAIHWLKKILAYSAAITTVFILTTGTYLFKYIENKYLSKTDNVTYYGEDYAPEVKMGSFVKGEEDSNIEKGVVLASENYKIKQIRFGGDVAVLSGSQDNLPLEIYDIRSETLSTKKGEDPKLLLTWKTNKLAVSEIEYSKQNSQNAKTIKEDNYGFSHSVLVSDLDMATAYTFMISSKDRWGNTKTSNLYAAYTGSKVMSIFELIAETVNDIFGWAIKSE